ncbi:hypothetical protein [Agrobacterium genomosp. 2]|uniref:hypothetical protein n=1 Tax=Agrobacterium genomosp. 2 TaxID=1183409 RepID=UPI0009BC37C7|nr:hypothetical protein [Agrobacterium genomosp. 2]
MKHRRGIDLLRAEEVGYTVGEGSRRSEPMSAYDTLDRLPEWYVILGYCPRCRRLGQVERRDIRRVLGIRAVLSRVAECLRCTVCGSRSGNDASLRKLPR